MKIGLIDVDGFASRLHTRSIFPNLALMKISGWHKAQGDEVSWYNCFDEYDRVYMSKVFNFSEDWGQVMLNTKEIVKGGTGYDIQKQLPREIDRWKPDYSIYPGDDGKTAMGFLTRGCPNKCKWCVVPEKEGMIMPYMDVDEIAVDGRTNLVLMDNNVLACEYGIEQIEKIVARGYKVDFNQAMDARLVTEDIAKLLAKVQWIKRIRFGCDTTKQIFDCERAIELIDSFGYKGEYFFYTMLNDNFEESFQRVNYWKQRNNDLVFRHKSKRFLPHAQPFRDVHKVNRVPMWQQDLARWASNKFYFGSCEFVDYEPRKGFKCGEYFE